MCFFDRVMRLLLYVINQKLWAINIPDAPVSIWKVAQYITVRIPSVDYAFSDRYRRPRFIPNYVGGVRATPLGAVPT